jgi:hypothetical protein
VVSRIIREALRAHLRRVAVGVVSLRRHFVVGVVAEHAGRKPGERGGNRKPVCLLGGARIRVLSALARQNYVQK